jgi:hypothetical protein
MKNPMFLEVKENIILNLSSLRYGWVAQQIY